MTTAKCLRPLFSHNSMWCVISDLLHQIGIVLAIHDRHPGRILSPDCNRVTSTAWRLLKTFLFVATAQCELL